MIYIDTRVPGTGTTSVQSIAVNIATGKRKPSDLPPESFTLAVGIGWENIDEYCDPKSVF